jgi:hypothetical protein
VKWLFGTAALIVLLGFAGVVVASAGIRTEVRAAGDWARQRHAGDAVQALLACVEDTTLDLKERNRAIWALGQLGDRRALPVLRLHHTGQRCDHGHTVCQHELDKAIKLIDGGVIVTRPSSILARLYAGPRVARAESTKNTKSP